MMRKSIDKLVGKLFLLVVICQSWKSEGACPNFDLRVAKGMADRGYDKIRVSVITTKATEGKCDFKDADFDFTEKFFGPEDRGVMNKMSEMTLRTSIKTVNPGKTCALHMGGEKVLVKTPAKGGGTRGLLFADPCVRQVAPGPACANGDSFQILERFSKAINSLVGSPEVDFWGIIGDNFYDASGDVGVEFWEALSLEAKAKPFITVPGNHDFWNAGSPESGFTLPGDDNGGYGWMQYFAQDVVGSSRVNATPFILPKSSSDFSWPGHSKAEPDNPRRLALPYSGIPLEENFVFWHQIGNVASFGFSGAHATGVNPATNHGRVDPYIEKFCKWVGESDDIVSWMVFGHWNGPNDGCANGMDTPHIYTVMRTKPGCAKKIGLYFDGHDHCNRITAASCAAVYNTFRQPVPPDCTDPLPVGYMIGASGMNGDCAPTSGFVVVDSKAKNIAVDYYDMGGFAALSSCWDANKDEPITKCRSKAQKWRDVPDTAEDILAQQSVRRMTPADVPDCGSPAPPPGPPGPPGPPAPPPAPSTAPVKAGDTKIPGDFKAAGFLNDQAITIGAGTATAEDNTIAGFGSIILKDPLKFDHDKGTMISAKAGPGPGPGPGGNMALIIGGAVGGLAIVAVIVCAVCHFKGAAVAPALDGSQLNPVPES